MKRKKSDCAKVTQRFCLQNQISNVHVVTQLVIYMLKAYLLKDVGTTAMVFPRQALADDWGIVSKRH